MVSNQLGGNELLKRMATEVGVCIGSDGAWSGGADSLMRFAAAVANVEREGCAGMCDERAAIERRKAAQYEPGSDKHQLWAMYSNHADQVAMMGKEIRMRTSADLAIIGREVDIGKWCYLTNPQCKGQLVVAQEARPSGMRMVSAGIVPYDEYRLAEQHEIEAWLAQ